ncbi:MAG: hypothetical protein HUJ27_17090 [Rhodobacteraceae bacterium]|nr:hypothetical protein [Paracoccaceae bacterium]
MEQFIADYGLAALFLGAAVEGDASVLFGAALLQDGRWTLWAVIVAAALGGWTSDLAIYGVARRQKDRRWVTKAGRALHGSRALSALLTRPALLALSFRFVPGARTVGPATLATVAPIRPVPYAALTGIAAISWAAALVLFGKVIVGLLARAADGLGDGLPFAIAAAVAVALGLIALLWRRQSPA